MRAYVRACVRACVCVCVTSEIQKDDLITFCKRCFRTRWYTKNTVSKGECKGG